MLTTREEIYDYLQDTVAKEVLDRVRINDDLSVDIYNITPAGLGQPIFARQLMHINGKLPFRINRCDGFNFNETTLSDLDQLPRHVEGVLFISQTAITSLVGIADHVKSMQRLMCTRSRVEEGGLGLLLIQNLSYFSFSSGIGNLGAEKAMRIINTYLGKPELIFECQQKLIDQGLSEFAKI